MSNPDLAAGNLVELLERRALAHPDRPLFSLLDDDLEVSAAISYGELAGRARAIAAELGGLARPGDRALLLYPFGLEFIAAFFGCLCAGVVAVPAYPPRSERGSGRLLAIVQNARPAVALTLAASRAARGGSLGGERIAIEVLATDRVDAAAAARWSAPRLDGETIAFIQYTSGSTALPKGVVVSHRNLLHNEEMIHQAFGQSAASVVVSWLPLYHDMGLIGTVLQPLYAGASCFLQSPVSFLQNPSRWLRAISRYRATTSGGPNFAYELCARRIGDEALAELDLGCWRTAFCGAEPVRAATLDRFASRFAARGFRREAFYPCYGLAEATLFVSGGEAGSAPVVATGSAAALERGRWSAAEAGSRDLRLVGCGRTWLGQDLRVVDAETCREMPPGEVGEIWVRGPSVARGYWQQAEASRATFAAVLAGSGEGPFLRTGDLGFLHDGAVFVTGRRKDLVIIRGRNLYPHDVELVGERAAPALRPGCSAAFAVEIDGEERLVLVAEVQRQTAHEDLASLARTVRAAVADELEVALHDLVLTLPGGVLKTSSGKVQRHACRDAYLAGQLPALEARATPPAAVAVSPPALGREALLAMGSEARRRGVLAHLRSQLAALDLRAAGEASRESSLTAIGVDSLAAVELKMRIEEGLGISVPLAEILGGMRLGDLADRLAAALATSTTAAAAAPETVAAAALAASPAAAGEVDEALPLSHGQRALWFVERLAADAGAYNLAAAARLLGELDLDALRRALRRLAERHAALRTTFHELDGEPYQRVRPSLEPELAAADASAWDDEELQRHLSEVAYRPFALAAASAWRVAAFSRSAHDHVLLLAVHHLVVDLWSLAILVGDLGALYGEETGGAPACLQPVRASFADQVRREAARLCGPRGEELWEHWRQRLTGDLPALELPLDHPRPPAQTYRGALRRLAFDEGSAGELRGVAGARHATPFTILLAVFQTLLHRYTGQRDVLVGTPTAGRDAARLRDVVGYFVNPVALRATFAGGATFDEVAAAAGRTVTAALADGDYPFSLLAQRLQPRRDPSRSPIFQVLFSLHRSRCGAAGLAGLAAGLSGLPLACGGLALEGLALDERRVPLDLAFNLAEVGDGLAVGLEYNVDLFDGTTIERFLGHFRNLVAAALADPGSRIADLPMLAAAEEAEILALGTGPAAPGQAAFVPALVEAQVERRPQAIAVVHRGREWSYRELGARAAEVARTLAALGVGPEVRVGVALERSPELVAVLLGVLEAGGAYVPVDPSHPAERSAAILEDAGVAVLIAHPGPAERLGKARPGLGAAVLLVDEHGTLVAPPARAASLPRPGRALVDPDQLAYLLYTSGSTGRPKGVEVSHRALATFLRSMQERPGFSPLDTLVAVSTVAFDIAGLEIFLPLIAGGRLVVADRETAVDPVRLLVTLRESGATVLQATPATWRLLVESGWDGRPSLKVLCGGEALPPDLAAALTARAAAVWNLYGPTETTIWSALSAVAGGVPVSLGSPVAGTTILLADAAGRLVPLGVQGELLIGGAGVSRGYRGRAELTAERFVPDPWSVRPGARLYRTGDVARRRGAGGLEFLGRSDHQVKIRGFRIELGEIEAVLSRHPAVQEAVVATRRQESGGTGPLLAAYLVASPPHRPAAAELRRFVGERLPEYMVPNAFVLLDAMPRTLNGKVDRRALPEPAAAAGAPPAAAPGGPAEELIAQVFAEVLARDRVGTADDFFALGGHSLLAARVVSRLRSAFGREVPLSEVFKHPTPAGLAAALARLEGQPPLPPVEPRRHGAEPPLSFPQQRLWFLDRLEPGSAVYNMPHAVRVQGRLAVAALRWSLNRIVERHEILRTTFGDRRGRAVQVVAPALEIALPRIDLTGLADGGRERDRRLAELISLPFDLERGPLLRAAVLDTTGDEHTIVLVMHHIVSDGWSMGALLAELERFYDSASGDRRRGAPPPLPPPLPLQYADFSAWQREHLPLAGDVGYWRERLAGMANLELPFDRPRAPVETYRGTNRPVRLAAGLASDLRALARRQGSTLFMAVLSAFQALLHRYSGQSDFGVGTPIANRFQSELEPLIGFFANTLVLRADLAGLPGFNLLLARVRASALAAYSHQHLPFERLVEELSPARNMSHNPLFQAMLVLQNAPLPPLELAGLALVPVALDDGSSKFDLTLFLWDEKDELAGTLEYSTGLFDAPTMQRLLCHFEALLAGVLADPELPVARVPLLLPAERQQLAVEWSDTAAGGLAATCVHEWVEAQAAATPELVAVEDGEVRLSYRELNALANRLARRLARLGVAPESLVGICVERSWRMVVALLAVLKAGGAGVALDPAYPRERLSYIVRDARLAVLLSEESLAAEMAELGAPILLLDRLGDEGGGDPGNPASGAALDNPIYAIYTSGSTGQPKGILVTHRAFANLLGWQLRHSSLARRARTAQFAAFGFCVSFQEIFTSLCSGGTLVLVGEALRRDLGALAEFVAAERIERLHLPFAALKNLAEVYDHGTLLPAHLAEVITAGEQLQISPSIHRLFSRLPGCSLHNQYGASETHVITAFGMAGPVAGWPDLPPVGRPVANTRIYLLDAELEPVPVGLPGEVCAGGSCLPRGYLRDAPASARKLIPDPFGGEPGGRLYRTGDLARRLPTGDVVYLGRIDSQVKIRGYRVELGEVESVLRQHPQVRDAAVVARQGLAGDGMRLVAYLVTGAGGKQPEPAIAGVRAFLKARLPEFMVPTHYLRLERLPINANGKLDHERLPEPEPGRPDVADFVPPRTPIEQRIAGVWSELLGLEQVGVRDNFFELGGHSLLATQVASRLQEAFGIRLPLRRLFDQPTVESLALAVDEALVEKVSQLSEGAAEELLAGASR
jgi:amino acid adenylation domain-containing protein